MGENSEGGEREGERERKESDGAGEISKENRRI